MPLRPQAGAPPPVHCACLRRRDPSLSPQGERATGGCRGMGHPQGAPPLLSAPGQEQSTPVAEAAGKAADCATDVTAYAPRHTYVTGPSPDHDARR